MQLGTPRMLQVHLINRPCSTGTETRGKQGNETQEILWGSLAEILPPLLHQQLLLSPGRTEWVKRYKEFYSWQKNLNVECFLMNCFFRLFWYLYQNALCPLSRLYKKNGGGESKQVVCWVLCKVLGTQRWRTHGSWLEGVRVQQRRQTVPPK